MAGTVLDVHADIVPPIAPCYMAVWYFGDQEVDTIEYSGLTSVVFDDGSVLSLDTSDGSVYTLDYPMDGSASFVTKWLNGVVNRQWINNED
jgi:hypothetical protein